MKIPDSTNSTQSTNSGTLIDLLRTSNGSADKKSSLFDEFSRTLDTIVSKLKRKSEASPALPSTEARHEHTPIIAKKDAKLEPRTEIQFTSKSEFLKATTKSKKHETDEEKTKSKPRCGNDQIHCTKAENTEEKHEDTESVDVAADSEVVTEDLADESTDQDSDEVLVAQPTADTAVPVVITPAVPVEEVQVKDEEAIEEKPAEEGAATEIVAEESLFVSEEQMLDAANVVDTNQKAAEEGPSETKPLSVPEFQQASTAVSAEATSSSSAGLAGDTLQLQAESDRSLETMILEKLLVGQTGTKSADLSAAQSSGGVSPALIAQSISSNFAALAESVLLQNSAQSAALKGPTLAAETASKQAAQGLQTINPTGMLNGSKPAEIADRKPESKETMKSLPRSLEVKTMERVESALKEVARSKDGKTISVRLDPPDLGTVKIDMTQRDGGIHARLVAESPQVTNLLKDKAQEVVQMLRKLGLNVDKVSVSVSNQEQQQSPNSFNQSFDSHVSDRRSEGEGNSSDSRRGNSRSGSKGSDVQLPKQKSVVTDHWVA